MAASGLRWWDMVIWLIMMTGFVFMIIQSAQYLRKLRDIGEKLEKSEKERLWFNNMLKERLAAISRSIGGLNKKVDDSSRKALLAVIYSGSDPLLRMNSLMEYIKDVFDRNMLDTILVNLILPNKVLWNRLVTESNLLENTVNKKILLASLDYIKERVLI